MPKITITETPDGASVYFEYDAALLARFKDAFPMAKWDAFRLRWKVSGADAVKRVQEFTGAMDKAKVDAATALAARAAEFPTFVSVYGNTVRAKFPYLASAPEICRSVPGAFFDEFCKTWRWKIEHEAEIAPLIAALKRIDEIRQGQVRALGAGDSRRDQGD